MMEKTGISETTNGDKIKKVDKQTRSTKTFLSAIAKQKKWYTESFDKFV